MMYVTYDGNYGSAANGDIIIFGEEQLNEEQMEMLDAGDTEALFHSLAEEAILNNGMSYYAGEPK